MADRIPLDSPLWESNHWTGVDDPREMIEKLCASDDPDPRLVESMLEGTYYVDNPSPHFYFLLPYLLDIFERHCFLSVIELFCIYLHRATDGRPSEECLAQLDASRQRIASLLMSIIDQNCVKSDSDYHQSKWMLAGLATAFNQSDLGRQIMGIEDDQMIN